MAGKRPDQHEIDQNEAGATDYKFRRKTEEEVGRPDVDGDEKGPAPAREAFAAQQEQAERGREEELERARSRLG